MANRVPLIVDTSTLQIKELPAGDSLDLTNSGIVNAGVITATSFSGNIGGTPTLGTGVTVTTSGLHVTGVVTATSGFSGDVTGDLTGNITGTPTLGTGVTVTTSGMNVSGVLTATSFSGDGSGLTNTGATLSAASGSQRLVVSSLTSGVMTTAATDTDLAWNASTNTLSATNVTIGGTLTYQDVTNIDSLGIVTARNGLRVTAGGINVTAGVSTYSGLVDVNNRIDVVGGANIDQLNVTGVTTFNSTVNLLDGDILRLGNDGDMQLYHSGSDSHVSDRGGAGSLYVESNNLVAIRQNDAAHYMAKFEQGAAVKLYHNNGIRVTTTSDGTDFGGTGAVGITKGTTGQRPGSPAAGDFRYNTSDGKFEGYTDEWGAIGGGSEEVDNIISQTTATGVGTFAATEIRSAYIRAQIQQGASYQVGRYLMIHDNSNVTVIEESAVATGNMLGSFDGVISGGNAVLRVTMVSAASTAVVTTLIDTITT